MAELRRLLAVSLPLAWMAASPAAAAELEWRVLPRSSVKAAHRVVVDLPGEVCRKRQPGEWRVNGRPRAIRFRHDDDAPSRCHASLKLRDDGDYEIALRGHEKTTIAIEDRLVVAFGDALGARGPRCGDGGTSGYEQALALLAAGSPHAALTYARRRCSAAGKTAALERQAQRLARIDERHGVDAVTLRFGGRHVRAAAVIRRCAKPSDCLDAAAPGGGEGTLSEFVDTQLATLPGKLDGLAKALENAGAPPAKVLVVPFVDPTLSPGGERCDTNLERLSREELHWIGDTLIGSLNLELKAAAERHGWRIAAGLPRAFVRNGPCAAEGDRWIRIVDGALLPNTAGRLVVAGNLAPSLATVLALAPVEHEDRNDWQKLRDWVEARWGQFWRWFGTQPFASQFVMVVIVLLAVVGLFAFAFGPTLRRASFIVRSAGRPSPGGARENPTRPHIEIPRTWLEFAVRTLAGAVTVLASAAFVTVVGAAILWCRFRAARIPADEAVAVVPESQFVVVGAQALILFAILALLAVLVVWIVDGKGRQVRATRRGLLVLLLAELVITIVIEEFPLRQAFWLFAGLALVAWLLHFLFERTLMAGSIVRTSALPRELWRRWRWFFRLDADAHGPAVVSVLVDAAGIVVGVLLLVLGTYLTGWVFDGANRLWGWRWRSQGRRSSLRSIGTEPSRC